MSIFIEGAAQSASALTSNTDRDRKGTHACTKNFDELFHLVANRTGFSAIPILGSLVIF
jgi:hypothetical protein